MIKPVIFILSHGRPDNVITYNTLEKQGYTGDVYIIIDDEDATADQYKERFGDKVIQFSKSEIAKKFDACDNFTDRRTIIYARNACFEIAEKLGIRYFMEFDDDYTRFEYVFTDKDEFCHKVIYKLDEMFAVLLKYYIQTNALSIAMAQGGDYLGGGEGGFSTSIVRRRKCMNSMICDTQRPYKFFGRINEDVNVYTTLGSRGNLFMTIPYISLLQKATQSNDGGMTDVYKAGGTYLKSFYSVINSPSSVKIAEMGSTRKRLHHKVKWKKAIPMIIREKYKLK